MVCGSFPPKGVFPTYGKQRFLAPLGPAEDRVEGVEAGGTLGLNHDKELAPATVGLPRVGHRHDSEDVIVALGPGELVGDRVAGVVGGVAVEPVGVTGLDHEVLNDAMPDEPVEEALAQGRRSC